MSTPAWLWIVFTLVAATAQTFRSAAQARLTGVLGTMGATHVRFLYGLPFGLLGLLVVGLVYGGVPVPTMAALLWIAAGALSQIAATALMLAAMRERSFVVTTAYTKTEPLQVAVFALAFLGEALSPLALVAILVATLGVVVMSWPSRSAGAVFSWRPAVLGIVAGSFFAFSAVAFRGGVLALDTPHYVLAASTTLAVALIMQALALSAFLVVRQRAVLGEVLKAWRPSLPAGFLGAFASFNWFLAFSLSTPAPVRTLGLIELLIAGVISGRLFQQAISRRDLVGMGLLVIGVATLLAVTALV